MARPSERSAVPAPNKTDCFILKALCYPVSTPRRRSARSEVLVVAFQKSTRRTTIIILRFDVQRSLETKYRGNFGESPLCFRRRYFADVGVWIETRLLEYLIINIANFYFFNDDLFKIPCSLIMQGDVKRICERLRGNEEKFLALFEGGSLAKRRASARLRYKVKAGDRYVRLIRFGQTSRRR